MRLSNVRLLPLVAVLVAGACSAADGSARVGVRYRPGDAVERLSSATLDRDDIGMIRDFDLSGDTLFLLDAGGRVVRAERRDSVWTLVGSFGRAGGGPGEFLTPSGLSAGPSSLIIIDNARLQFFTRGGDYAVFRLLALPCPMLRAGVARSETGLFVHGNCVRGSFVTDTMKSVLAWSADTATWQIVAEDLRFTRDGSAGNLFTASSALTPGSQRTHLFGSGATNCISLVSDSIAPPTAVRHCPAAVDLYTAAPPPGVRERLRGGAVRGVRLDWPETLPVYVERIRSGGAVLLIRPYSTDSIVVQQAAPLQRDLAVAPLDGLIGCKAAGCLWVLGDTSPPRVIVLDTASLTRRLRAGAQ